MADTRTRIEEAIAALGYVPSWAARNLRLGRRGTIGVVIRSSADPWTTVFLAGIQDEVEARDASLVRATLGPGESDWWKVQAWIRDGRTDGLILADLCASPAIVAAAASRSLPILGVVRRVGRFGSAPVDQPARDLGRAVCRRLFDIADQNGQDARPAPSELEPTEDGVMWLGDSR